MIIKKRQLKRMIREEIGRSFKTINNDPFSYENYEELNIEIYPTNLGGAYHVKIETVDGTISLPTRSFTTEHEAKHYARNKADELRRILGARQR